MIENIAERNRDFCRAVRVARRHMFESGSHLTNRDIVAYALRMPAPQYYISYKTAEMQLRLYRANRLPRGTRHMTWELLAELSQRVDAELTAHRDITLGGALARVLSEGRASRFFMTPGYALRCYYRVGVRRRSLDKN